MSYNDELATILAGYLESQKHEFVDVWHDDTVSFDITTCRNLIKTFLDKRVDTTFNKVV